MLPRLGLVVLAAAAAAGENHALLIASSNGFQNYRHQADVGHAYQMLTLGGFKAENIVTFMYNDVANHKMNPVPGKLFNRAAKSLEEANDVYAEVKDHIDYQWTDLTGANILAALTGDAGAVNNTGNSTGRVLKSGAEDNVFVYFADHGGQGFVCTPDGGFACSAEIHAQDLLDAFKTMQKKKMYKTMVVYVEACYSGSMFKKILPKNMGIYAVTPTNDYIPSLASCCGDDAKIGDAKIYECLGDMWSTNWLQYDDTTDLTSVTLNTQYKVAKNLTTESPSQQFGDLSITSEDVNLFQGAGNTLSGKARKNNYTCAIPQSGLVRDMMLEHLRGLQMRAGSEEERSNYAAQVAAELQHRKEADALFAALQARLLPQGLAPALALEPKPVCWKAAHTAVKAHCGPYSEYSLKHSSVVAAACNLRDDAAAIEAVVKDVCANNH